MKQGYLLYLVGISGSGKSTIANELENVLREKGVEKLQVIDGDTIRQELGGIFGYTFEERMKNNQVVRVIVKYLLNNGISVILSQVGAYRQMRDKMRETFQKQYLEIYVKCSLEECKRRDVKGYYQKKLGNLNGLTDRFEEPEQSELIIDTEKENVKQAVQKIIQYLEENHYEL